MALNASRPGEISSGSHPHPPREGAAFDTAAGEQMVHDPGPEGRDAVDDDPSAEPTPQVRVGSYDAYADAQAAMDRLSDAGVDISGAAITWSGLRRIEYVVGRRTNLTAARDGLLSGAWLGLIVSLLLLLFVEVDPDINELGFLLTWTLVFAVVGAAWSAIMHASMRGTRDFSTMPRLEAERYDIWIDARQAARARSLISSIR